LQTFGDLRWFHAAGIPGIRSGCRSTDSIGQVIRREADAVGLGAAVELHGVDLFLSAEACLGSAARDLGTVPLSRP